MSNSLNPARPPRHVEAASPFTCRHEMPVNRRDFLQAAGGGFGAIALSAMLARQPARAAPTHSSLAAKPGHHRAKAKSVIFIFIEGGPSHIDLFDPKPELDKLAGKPLPSSFKPLITAMGEFHSPILASKRKWKQHGQSGLWVSDWLPHIATLADDMAVLRSCHGNGINHVGGVTQMNTGTPLAGRPSLGSWVSYGLGTENESLPSFVVMLDKGSYVVGGPRVWSTGFMPATYQGTALKTGSEPIENLYPDKDITDARQRGKLDLLERMNRRHLEGREDNTELEARIRSYELAFRMQSAAPEAVDLAKEPAHLKTAYGFDDTKTADMARCCLMARRLVERGVRFVQIYSGAGSKWDAHSGIEGNHSGLCLSMDQPVAALAKDLKQRGMLDETLVIWGGEFGRTPMSEKGTGRDHNPWGFTMWFAGGGIKPGVTVGATDEVGLHAVEDRAHIHDIHATILHTLGLNHEKLVYLNNGRPERPTINEGHVIDKLLA